MSFAAEIKDFLAAYTAVSGVLNENSRLDLAREDAASRGEYRDWLMGAQGRGDDAIVNFGRTGDVLAPFDSEPTFNSGGGGTANLSGGDREAQAMNYFVGQGLTSVQASGLVGNLIAESGGELDPGAIGDSGASHGIMQAQGDRWTNLYAALGDNWGSDFEGQLDFIWGELNSSESQHLARLQRATTPEEAAAAAIGYERPRGWTWENPSGGHNFSGRLANTRGLYQKYASLSPESIVAELAGTEPVSDDMLDEVAADNNSIVPEGGDIDELTGSGGSAMAPVTGRSAGDPLGVYDPDYVGWREASGQAGTGIPTVEMPGAMPGGSLGEETPAELPGVEPVSTEGAEAISSMPGFDPLPQTTGYTDPVSRAGSADEINSAMDTPVDRKQLFSGILNFGRKVLGANPRGAVDTDEADPGGEAMDAGIGGADAGLVERLEGAIEERYPGIPQPEKSLRVMSTIWNWWQRKGQPNKAVGAAFSIYQTYKQISQKSLALAQVAASEGNYDEAIEFFQQAYDIVPDGEVTAFARNENGTYNITTKDIDGNVKKEDYNLDPKQIVSTIMNITPDQFDSLVEAQILGNQPEADSTGFGEVLEDYGAAGSPDEAITTAPADGISLGSDLGPEIPAGEDEIAPGVETSPMGVNIPPEAGNVPIDGDVQVASADATAPMGEGGALPKLPPTNAPTVRPTPEAPEEPMNPKEFRQFLVDHQIKDKYIAPLTSIWEQDVNMYQTYLESLPTAEQVRALDAYNAFFKEMQAVPVEEFFDTSQSSIAGIGDPELMGIAQRVADARNKEFERITTEKATQDKADLDIISTDILEEQRSVIPTEDEFYAPQQQGDMPGDWDNTDAGPLYGQAPEVFPTHITGRTPVRGKHYRLPTGGDMSALSREDRTVLQGDADEFNEGVDAWNTGLTVPPARPVTSEETALMGELSSVYTMIVGGPDGPGTIANNEDPIVVKLATFMGDRVANTGKQDDVINAARSILGISLNEISNEGAVQAAWDFVTFHPGQPTETLFTATRVLSTSGMPPGLVEVHSILEPKNPPIFIPERVFVQLDDIRRNLAEEWMATGSKEQFNDMPGLEDKSTDYAPYVEPGQQLLNNPPNYQPSMMQ